MQNRKVNVVSRMNNLVMRVDSLPLWWIFFLLFAVVFTPFWILKEGSIFIIHDQLDEYMMNTVLVARHLGEGLLSLPEMMGGINIGGLQPGAVLFVPLYRIMPEFWAFIVQHAVCFAVAFLGMYFCVKELTGSSILSLVSGGCFCMLPMYTVYGLSQMGIPMVLYCFLNLARGKKKWISFAMIIFYGLASHLVYTGYVVLSLWLVALAIMFFCKRMNKWSVLAFFVLLFVYVITNWNLFQEILLGQGDFVSHREEMIGGALPFWSTAIDMFINSGQHTPSYHQYLIVPILVMLVIELCCWKKLSKQGQHCLLIAVGGMLFLFAIALFCGLCSAEIVVDFQNKMTGFLHYFQIDRYYWLYPAGWYLEFVYTFSILWRFLGEYTEGSREFWKWPVFKAVVLMLILLPTLQLIKVNSIFYMNVNQINNGSGVTGYISWENFYAEDLMEELESTIGRDMSTYRIAHLGISPAPSLMHGFYTVDGYSNNYPLEYKHKFRRVIAEELEKNEETRVYFDTWGNRCYLFNGITGNYYMIRKGSDIKYENLAFDMEALRELGCEYLFSGGEILDAADMGLELMGYYETEKSYWGIWLYQLKN